MARGLQNNHNNRIPQGSKIMAMYEFSGKVIDISETQSFGSKGFTKRTFVVSEDTDSKYPNEVSFTCKKDRCALLDGINKGQHVKVKFAVEGRRWDGPNGVKFFVDLNAINVVSEGGENISVPPPAVAPEAAQAASADPDPMDLPF